MIGDDIVTNKSRVVGVFRTMSKRRGLVSTTPLSNERKTVEVSVIANNQCSERRQLIDFPLYCSATPRRVSSCTW